MLAAYASPQTANTQGASGPNDGDVVEQGKSWGKGKNKGNDDNINEPGKGKDTGKGSIQGKDEYIINEADMGKGKGDDHV